MAGAKTPATFELLLGYLAALDGAGRAARSGSRRRAAPTFEYYALEAQVRELQRLLDKKAMNNELLR